MIVTKRTQGRPSRDSGVNGREKLIEATRTYLRTYRTVRLARTEIANGCGVTPALITYHFKDTSSLIEAVTKPLIRSYAAQFQRIGRQNASLDDRLRQTVHLLIAMNIDDAFLVDYLLAAFATGRLDEDDRLAVEAVRRTVADLLAELAGAEVRRSSATEQMEVALWGMCRASGETLRVRLASPLHAVRRDQVVDESVGFVCAALVATSMAVATSVAEPLDFSAAAA